MAEFFLITRATQVTVGNYSWATCVANGAFAERRISRIDTGAGVRAKIALVTGSKGGQRLPPGHEGAKEA